MSVCGLCSKAGISVKLRPVLVNGLGVAASCISYFFTSQTCSVVAPMELKLSIHVHGKAVVLVSHPSRGPMCVPPVVLSDLTLSSLAFLYSSFCQS